jgi:hypothetical protein
LEIKTALPGHLTIELPALEKPYNEAPDTRQIEMALLVACPAEVPLVICWW